MKVDPFILLLVFASPLFANWTPSLSEMSRLKQQVAADFNRLDNKQGRKLISPQDSMSFQTAQSPSPQFSQSQEFEPPSRKLLVIPVADNKGLSATNRQLSQQPRFLKDSKLSGNEIIVKFERKKQLRGEPGKKERRLSESSLIQKKVSKQQAQLSSILTTKKSFKRDSRFQTQRQQFENQRKSKQVFDLVNQENAGNLKNRKRERKLRDFRSFEKLEQTKKGKNYF